MTEFSEPTIDEEEYDLSAARGLRTDYCGELSADDEGRTVTVCGWVDRRREHGEKLAFVDLRDHTGIVQCVVDERLELRNEFVAQITGTVVPRGEERINPNISTGEIELHDCEVVILNTAEPSPFPLHSRQDVDENVRLKYRYIDMRRDRMQRNLRYRAIVNSTIRNAMESQGFVELETPMLIASTPEGARDFVVPARNSPGEFYALPQSPQLFKQLSMVGGLDRYFQIARCLRDEDLRADRQFEFMQLDAEASFVGQDEILTFIEYTIKCVVDEVHGYWPDDFPVMTYHDAMEFYGSDKPDTRFDMLLVDITDMFEGTEANVFKTECVKGILAKGGAEFGRNRIDELTDMCKKWGAAGLAWFRVGEDSALDGALTKFMSDAEIAELPTRMGAEPGDLILLQSGDRHKVNTILGRLRLEIGRPAVDEGGFQFLWVIDFPMFEGFNDKGDPIAAHHPFTMPHPEDIDYLVKDGGQSLLKIRSKAYDLVLNGWELGSGSVRIHDSEIQKRVFAALGIGDAEAEAKFGFLLDAFRYGAPPHAGFAFGIDRLTALLLGEENIREVIAFPKTQSGGDPLTNAPGPIDDAHLTELGLRLLPPT